MKFSSIKSYYFKNLIKISFDFKLNKTVPLYMFSITALYTQSYEVLLAFHITLVIKDKINWMYIHHTLIYNYT